MLLALLLVVGVLTLAVSTLVQRWSDALRREQEQELLRVGNEIAAAIASYRKDSQGSLGRYPPRLDDLLEDHRAFGLVRHLRRIEPDPVNRGAPWGLIRAADGGILGVYSQSEQPPLAQVSLRLSHADLPVAVRYSQWRFVPREAQE